MTAVANTTAETPKAPGAEIEVDYGYEDTGIDYGYGDAEPSPAEPAPEQPKTNNNNSGQHGGRHRRLSSFVGSGTNTSTDGDHHGGGGGGGAGGGGGGGGGGGHKRRGRRLSMFAFAGQDNDMDEFNKNGTKEDSNKDHKGKGAKTQQRRMDDISSNSGHHGGGMLGSFFRGGGGGNNNQGGGGDAKGPTRRRGRRLSMIAFDGGNHNLNSEDGHDVSPPKSEPPEAAPEPSNRRNNALRGGSSHTSPSADGATRKNKYYPAVQLPAEYLADASANKPITRTMGTGGTTASHGSVASAQQFSSQQPVIASPARRAQRRSSFGGALTPSTTAVSPTNVQENSRRYTMVGSSPEQTPTKYVGRPPHASPGKGPPPSPNKHPRGVPSPRPGAHPSNGHRGQGSSLGHSSSHSASAPHQSKQISGKVGMAVLDQSGHSTPQSPRTQKRAIGKLAVQGVPEASIHKVSVPSEWSTSLDSNDEGVVEEESELQQYMKSMELGSSSHSAQGGGASVNSSNVSSSASVGSSAGMYRKEVAAMAREARALTAAGIEPGPNNMSLLYILARCCDWSAVLEEVKLSPRDAKVVSEKDGTTALHLAVMSRTNPMMRDGKAGEPAPMEVVEALVQACPEAAIIRCAKKRYTPLCYACLVADVNYDMDDCAKIVELLIKHAPHSPFVFTDDGFSALDIHILSYSQLHKHKEEIGSGSARAMSTVVLQTLLTGEPSLADARVYRNKIRGPLELLYRCNIDEFKEAVDKQEELELNDDMDQEHVEAVLSDWWAWKWSLMLLRYASISAGQDVSPFKAVHASARLVGCPLPVLALSVNTFPKQVTERDPTGDIYNVSSFLSSLVDSSLCAETHPFYFVIISQLPLHEVCSWRADTENVAGDPFIATRKFKAMRMLLEQFPEAARMTNNCGETPLQLAVETCTPWHGGLEALVEACPKALKFPRKLRITDNGLSLAVANHSAIDSVATYDSEEPDPLEPLENMYPFLVSAVLGGVSRNKLRPPVSFSDEMAKEHYANLERKDLQAVRAVYGLLRARPEVLAKYRNFMKQSGA